MFLEKYRLNKKTRRFSLSHLIRPSGLVLIFTLVGFFMLSAQLLIANKLATDGETLSKKELLTLELIEENEKLMGTLTSISSLKTVNIRAKELGLVKVDRVEIYAPVPLSLAQ